MAWEVAKPITLKYNGKTEALVNGAAGEDRIAQSIMSFAQKQGVHNFVVVVDGRECADPADLPDVEDLAGKTIEIRNYAKAGC